jgi:hypothetical protein
MIWFMRIDSFLDHALTALAALPRVKASRFFRGLSWCIAGARSLLNGQAWLGIFDLGLVWHIILLPAHHRVLVPLWRGN